MKILHTSDWHLGHTLYGHERDEEQMSMLHQMIDIVESEKPDLFLLCGDVYHTPQPSSAVQTMFTEALVKIHEANPSMTIVATAGNHDSGTKHEIYRTPWQALKVYSIGCLDKDNLENHIVEIPGMGYVVAIPYVHERNLPEGFFQNVLDLVAQRNEKNLPVVMTAHTTVQGCDFSGHDNASEYCVGGIDSFNIADMGEGYDYLALGHIHKEQFVHTGKHNVRYCGTPLPINFDEKFSHSVSIVEIASHGDKPDVRTIEITNSRPLVTLPTDGYKSWDEVKQLLIEFSDDNPAYIRLNVEIDDFLPVEAAAEARALTLDKKCKFCHINSRRKSEKQIDSKTLTVQEFQAKDPLDIVKQYADDTQISFDEDMIKLFDEALTMIKEEERK